MYGPLRGRVAEPRLGVLGWNANDNPHGAECPGSIGGLEETGAIEHKRDRRSAHRGEERGRPERSLVRPTLGAWYRRVSRTHARRSALARLGVASGGRSGRAAGTRHGETLD